MAAGVNRERRKRNIVLALSVVIIVWASGTFALRNVRRVKAIECRGVQYLSRYEILGDTVARIENDYLVVDVDALSAHLNENPMVASFRIVIDGERLRIVLVENEPMFIIAVKREKRLHLFELDRELSVISRERVHTHDCPLIILSERDIQQGNISRRIVEFLELLRELQSQQLAVYGEIAEIDLYNFEEARLYLRGRRTAFILNPSWESFQRLNDSVAYLDSRGHYPDMVKVYARFVVLQ
jgi:cell division septal protein FtsQ